MKTKVREIDLESKLETYFKNKDDASYSISRQVYFGGKKIDMVVVSEGIVSSIEVKISDWKTALRQANLNRLGSDYSYVAMWHEDAEKAMDNMDRFISSQVGLIILDSNSHPFYVYSPKTVRNNRLVGNSKSCLLASALG